jgi:hypothetical protein
MRGWRARGRRRRPSRGCRGRRRTRSCTGRSSSRRGRCRMSRRRCRSRDGHYSVRGAALIEKPIARRGDGALKAPCACARPRARVRTARPAVPPCARGGPGSPAGVGDQRRSDRRGRRVGPPLTAQVRLLSPGEVAASSTGLTAQVATIGDGEHIDADQVPTRSRRLGLCVLPRASEIEDLDPMQPTNPRVQRCRRKRRTPP